MNFPFQRGDEVKNWSIITAPNIVVRQKNKKTHIIVKSIYSSLRSESKIKFPIFILLNIMKTLSDNGSL